MEVMMVTDAQIVIRLLLCAVLSGLIGLEREMHRRTAGLRTHILVSLGSCLIMLTSLFIFDTYRTMAALDPARIAAGVITGIGFLGAGAIIQQGVGVRGLTTAASLWMVAGIGLAIGCGFYTAGVFTTALTLVVLYFVRYIEPVILGKAHKKGEGEDNGV
jgi:putative Mg2+ transporter-C (MgtC) family protein